MNLVHDDVIAIRLKFNSHRNCNLFISYNINHGRSGKSYRSFYCLSGPCSIDSNQQTMTRYGASKTNHGDQFSYSSLLHTDWNRVPTCLCRRVHI